MLVYMHSPEGSRGVLLNLETPFLMGEMAEGMGCFAESPVFRGGGAGPDSVIMLHDCAGVEGAVPVGDSGLYVGGLRHAQELVEAGEARVDRFKFFFNQEIWAAGEIDAQLEKNVWWVLNGVPPADVLENRGNRGVHAHFKRKLSARQ